MIFLTGGAPLSLSAARKMAMRIGGSGGYIEAGLAKGVMGGWTESLSTFGGYHPGDGHVVIAGFFSQGSGKNDYLYRHSVPGQAELNTIKTALHMEGNDINAVNQLNANKVKTDTLHATGSAHIEGALRSGGDMTTDGWLITQGAKGWYSSEGEGGWHMTDKTWIKAYNGKSIYTSGTVRGGTVQLDHISISGHKCTPNGLLSRDASGALLSCQSGVWKGAGGGNLSRAGVNALSVESTGPFHFVLVSISSRFFAVDGSHTAMANFTLSLNGRVREQITNGLNVRKTGGGGHYWGYDTVGVVQKQYRLTIAQGDHLRVALSSAHYHLSSDIRIDLSN